MANIRSVGLSEKYTKYRERRIVHMRDVIKPPVRWGIIAKRFGIDPHVVKSIYEGAKDTQNLP